MQQTVKKKVGALPFITTSYGKHGKYLARSEFDVPAEAYGDGWLTGMEAAAQFMDAIRENRPYFSIASVLEAVAKARDDSTGWQCVGRCGAATGFLAMIEAMLRATARDYDCGAWIRERRDEQAELHAEAEASRQAEQAERNRAFVARMQAAKQAKRVREEEQQVA
ncbi:MAG: hypothetical protein ROZ64_16540 [Burkholderiaceae bacterium]|jgi:hypothetical protein|nr:hypothetical protein [Burkholderiaceae bacterium]